MNRVQTMFTKSLLVAAAGLGLPACVAVAPEPARYYASPGYYNEPGYYAPRPAYSSYYLYYEDRDSGRRHHRGHRHRHHH